MILQTLNDYYERLAQNASEEIPPYGFSIQRIAFAVVLKPDGTLSRIENIQIPQGKKMVNRPVVVPGQAKPSGAGINPCFLWDNAAYMLGHKEDDKKPERTRESFEAFRAKHLALENEIGSPEYTAVCRFLETWNPDKASEHEPLRELSTGFGVFRIEHEIHYVHEISEVVEFWQSGINSTQEKEFAFTCLITGKQTTEIAVTHEPPIKGVMGAQSAGAKIVSFNCQSFESYGKDQSYNSPVSERAAFQYATALNHLLRSGSRQRVLIGDTTTVFWTEKPSPAEDLFAYLVDPAQDTEKQEDTGLAEKLRSILETISTGAFPGDLGDPATRFYILGLAPNAARLSIRFWHTESLGDIASRLGEHFANMKVIKGPKNPEYPAVWQLLSETARERKDIQPLLGGTVLRAILTGSRYPTILPQAVLNRIRADFKVNSVRAGILKAFLIKNHNQHATMSLDPDNTDPAYRLGRLFSALEKTQEDALPGINATIRERFYSSASATPTAVFPRILRTYQHHLAKLSIGLKKNRERLVQEILDPLTEFPRNLNLQGQAQFALGYYHQRQAFFTKKSHDTDTQE